MIRADIAAKWGLRPSGAECVLVGVGRTRVPAYYAMPVSFQVGGRTLSHVFVVAPTAALPYQAVVGMDLMRQLRMQINWETMRGQPGRSEQGEAIYALETQDLEESSDDEEGLADLNMESGLNVSPDLEELLTESRLEGELRDRYREILLKHPLAWKVPRVGTLTVGHMTLRTDGGKPVVARAFRLRPEEEQLMRGQVDQLVERGALRPCVSEWSSPAFFVSKKGTKERRLVVDYRALNKRLLSDNYPLPRIPDMLQFAVSFKFRATLDARWGFWLMKLDPESMKYTAIRTPFGTFEWTVCPMGLKTSPSAFQRAMDTILHPFKEWAKAYLDDIIIGGNTMDELLERMEQIFRTAATLGLFLNARKIQLGRELTDLLGHVLEGQLISPCPKYVENLRGLPFPRSRAGMIRFLASVQWVSRHIPWHGDEKGVLGQLTHKGKKYQPTAEHHQAFNLLQAKMIETISHQAIDWAAPFVLVTDASDGGVGAALAQKDSKGELVIVDCCSKTLNSTARRWDVRERELFAIRHAVEQWAWLLKGAQGTVAYTDHQTLEYMPATFKPKVYRWLAAISAANVEIKHIAGTDNSFADWLSRLPEEDDDEFLHHDLELVSLPLLPAEQTEARAEIAAMDTRKRLGPTTLPSMQELRAAYPADPKTEERAPLTWDVEDEIWKCKDRLWIPLALRTRIIHWFHMGNGLVHLGQKSTAAKLSRTVYWGGLSKDVEDFCKDCLRCKANNGPTLRSITNVLAHPIPLEVVSLDHGELSLGGGLKVTYLCILDHCTRFMQATITASLRATEALEVFKGWLAIFGPPRMVIVDNGPMASHIWKSFVGSKLQAVLARTAAYHPQGNGMNERTHRFLKTATATALSANQGWGTANFPELLREIVWLYNAAPHRMLGASPFFALFGIEPGLPGWDDVRNAKVNAGNYQALRTVWQRDLAEKILLDWIQSQQAQAKQIDKVGPGTWVLACERYDANLPKTKYEGLFKVLSVGPNGAHLSRFGSPLDTEFRVLTDLIPVSHDMPPELTRDALQWLQDVQPQAMNPAPKRLRECFEHGEGKVSMDDLEAAYSKAREQHPLVKLSTPEHLQAEEELLQIRQTIAALRFAPRTDNWAEPPEPIINLGLPPALPQSRADEVDCVTELGREPSDAPEGRGTSATVQQLRKITAELQFLRDDDYAGNEGSPTTQRWFGVQSLRRPENPLRWVPEPQLVGTDMLADFLALPDRSVNDYTTHTFRPRGWKRLQVYRKPLEAGGTRPRTRKRIRFDEGNKNV